jgi:hypothetical protein
MKTTELLFEWLENYEKDRVKARTYSRYRSLIDLHLVPALGDIDIENLSRRQIQEFLSQKKKTVICVVAKQCLLPALT